MVSNAFSTSKKTAAVDILKFKVAWFVSRICWSVVLWRTRNQNWHGFSVFPPHDFVSKRFRDLVTSITIYCE
jgi:hypothetical protein